MWSVDSNILSLLVLSTLLDFINTSRLICVNSGNTRELIFAILVSELSVLIVCWAGAGPGWCPHWLGSLVRAAWQQLTQDNEPGRMRRCQAPPPPDQSETRMLVT